MEPNADEGQVEATSGDGQVEETPDASQGQSVASNQTTEDGPGAEEVESFFDPKDVIGTPNEAGYKQMQAEFTKKMQGISGSQDKIDAYNAFMADPRGSMEQLSRQYGYNFVQGDPNANGADQEFQPKTWADVMKKARDEVRQEFEPLTNEVQNLKRKSVEQYFDANHSDWRSYESGMIDTLAKHPSMANDPDSLYRLSVPPEILEARATKAALKKLKGEGESSAVSGNQTTSVSTTTKPTKPISIDEAFKIAKAELGARGLTAPVE